ncbi:g1071 [Coccomyxa viridis]|uniref:G1071 protein n=1 Tax=Coccomyxa viridis TaxID=1274662 RepID=A0ABP1FHB1_9CHLO
MTRTKIPARYGKAARLKKGESIKVINDSGTQVVDTWAFNAEDMSELMSMEHTRAGILRLIPQAGDKLLTNKRRPILTVMEDTCGVHDLLIAACDIYRYQVLGVKEYHRSCTENLHEGLSELGLVPPEVPSPFNLWMNIPWTQDPKPCGSLGVIPPVSKPGDYIVLRAEMDCIVAFSACPQDVIPVNGVAGTGADAGKFKGEIHDCHFEIMASA